MIREPISITEASGTARLKHMKVFCGSEDLGPEDWIHETYEFVGRIGSLGEGTWVLERARPANTEEEKE